MNFFKVFCLFGLLGFIGIGATIRTRQEIRWSTMCACFGIHTTQWPIVVLICCHVAATFHTLASGPFRGATKGKPVSDLSLFVLRLYVRIQIYHIIKLEIYDPKTLQNCLPLQCPV